MDEPYVHTTAPYPEEWVIGWCIKKIVFCGRSLPGHPTVPATAKYFFLLSVFEYWWERCWSMVTSRRSKYFLGYAKSFSKVLSLSTSPTWSNAKKCKICEGSLTDPNGPSTDPWWTPNKCPPDPWWNPTDRPCPQTELDGPRQAPMDPNRPLMDPNGIS